jgi:LysM repeat protein
MSRRPGQHAKTKSAYDARHAKPGSPGPAALIGTAAKAVPASLVAGAAGSALVLSGTATAASAATIPAGLVNASVVKSGATELVAVKAAAPGVVIRRGRHHAARRSVYAVVPGDTLSGISARFCGTAADYLSLAGASGIANPNLIYPGQHIRLACHADPIQASPPSPVTTTVHRAASGRHHRHAAHHQASAAPQRRPGRHSRTYPGPGGHVSTAGMAAFEACVISRESGGNPRAVNPYSGAGGLFQFLPSTWASLGYAGAYPGGAQTAPVSVQEQAFAKLYAEAGTSPWAPYDGC